LEHTSGEVIELHDVTVLFRGPLFLFVL